jgi:prophage regulatory protein
MTIEHEDATTPPAEAGARQRSSKRPTPKRPETARTGPRSRAAGETVPGMPERRRRDSEVPRLLKARDVRLCLGISSATTLRAHVRRGILTPGIPLGSGGGPTTPLVWPDTEIDEIVRARIAGWSEDAMRALVAKLEAARADAG